MGLNKIILARISTLYSDNNPVKICAGTGTGNVRILMRKTACCKLVLDSP